MSSMLVTLCLVGGGAFLVTFIATTIQQIVKSRSANTEDADNNEGEE